jgi:predicted ribosomally synthesized peptide with nif11-like leader
MSQTDLEQFCERVLQNQSLQEKLRSISDRQAFIASVVQLGTEQGFTFSVEEVQTAMQNMTRAWIERFVC